MKKILALAILALAPLAHATCATSTTAGLCSQWTAPAVTTTTVAAATYNLYQIPMSGTSCTAFAISTANLAANGITTTQYTQTTVPNGTICTEVAAVSSAGVIGPASPVVQFPLPATAPGAPTGLNQVLVP